MTHSPQLNPDPDALLSLSSPLLLPTTPPFPRPQSKSLDVPSMAMEYGGDYVIATVTVFPLDPGLRGRFIDDVSTSSSNYTCNDISVGPTRDIRASEYSPSASQVFAIHTLG